jgi:hypothetical protein
MAFVKTVERPTGDFPACWLREVPFDLGPCLRANGVTIRELKARTGLTLKVIRKLMAKRTMPWTDALGLYEAITGEAS